MATVITAGNATNGLSFTPDNTGSLEIKTGTGAGTTALTLTSSQIATFAGAASVPGDLSFNSGYGSSAVAYACRAWVSFNGSGTPTRRGSGNVSSITDVSAGQFGINMTTAMPDTNYCIAISTSDAGSGGVSTMYAYIGDNASARTTSTFRLVSVVSNGATFFDSQYLSAAVFR